MKNLKMTFKQIKQNKIVQFITNKYVVILLFFIVWMLFFDENSYLNHRELNAEIDKLEDANAYYKTQIEADNKIIENLNDPDSLEKYAREEYKMKRQDEEIFIIEYDSIKN
ncbi:MAG: septum formation initiator family protein [Flavobacteriaceae bacterium]|nr:septum formation initiator family protein [Flavobacteriaceae bacterium]